MNIDTLVEEDIFKYFIKLSQIPRCSHKEKKVADYLEDFAVKHRLKHIRDQFNNVIIKRPTKSTQTVALQAHIDMVCIKTTNSKHNFNIDPLTVNLDNNLLSAKETTLGADNGIGLSYMLALLNDPNYIGPNLECIFTTNEEEGMTGAEGFDITNLKADKLINLDSEEEGLLYVSSAGGIISNLSIPISHKTKEGNTYTININGLKGGHSGLEINKNRGNAIKFAARILNYLQEESIQFRLIDISGGKKHNAIPTEAKIDIMLKEEEQYDSLSAIINNSENIFRKEYNQREPNTKVILQKGFYEKVKVFSKSTDNAIIGVLNLLPNGVMKMSEDIPDLVETSVNIGKLWTDLNYINIIASIRSSNEESIISMVDTFNRLKIAFNLLFKTEYPYPAWSYNKNSKLKETAKAIYKNIFQKEFNEIAMHAGLECSFFINKKADLDIISFGPTIKNIHTTEESVDIDSVRRVYELLKEILIKLK